VYNNKKKIKVLRLGFLANDVMIGVCFVVILMMSSADPTS